MPQDHTDDEGLRGLAQRYWETVLAASPTSATLLGVHDHDDRLEDLSVGAEHALRERLASLRDRLAGVDASGSADRVTAALLSHQLGRDIEAVDLGLAELRSDHLLGPHAELLTTVAQLTLPEPAHADAVLVRYEQVPRMLGQALDRFRAGLGRGRTPAAAVLARSLHTLGQYLGSPVEADPFLAPQLPAGWDGAERWRSEAEELVRATIRPAMAAYCDALRDELGPAARDDDHPGWSWLPDGDELYAAMIRTHTSLDLAPQELHELGRRLCEVDLVEEYRRVAPDAIGEHEPARIFERLRTDPALRHRDAAEVLETARRSVDRAAGSVAGWFGRLPAVACEVRPVPEFLAADAPYAYYFPPATDGSRPGTYFINTADPAGSSRTEAQSIAFHEALPGHHLQLALAQELDVAEFQRHDGATSYIEGWGLYAERLADEMGLYDGPLDRLGMLSADSWRSARLVVDTGLHALGWSRSRAIEYLETHTPVPTDQIAPEVDRYLAMPGQALAYKVGHLHIERLRAQAAERLGARFDVAGFHDVVLGSGAVTLPVLGGLVEDWVDRRRLSPDAPR